MLMYLFVIRKTVGNTVAVFGGVGTILILI